MCVLASCAVVGLAFRLFVAAWGQDSPLDLQAYGGYGLPLLALSFLIGSLLYFALRRRDVI